MSTLKTSRTISFLNADSQQNEDSTKGGRILMDLSSTKISVLPSFEMKNLKQLYLEKNELTELPENIFTDAPNLQWLDLRSNKLTNIPKSITNHECLETILLQNNKISHLPTYLCTVKCLKHLKLTGNPIIFPKMHIVQSGTENIMKCLFFHYEKEDKLINNSDWDQCVDISDTYILEKAPTSHKKIFISDSKINKVEFANHELNVEVQINAQASASAPSEWNQAKTPTLNVKNHKKECKTVKMKSFRDKFVAQPNHSICNVKLEKSLNRTEPINAESALFKYFNSNKYVKKSKVLNKHEQTLKIVQTAIDEKMMEKKKDLLNRREKVLQDRKSLEALKHWRNSYKESKETNPHIYYTLNLSNLPYDTDIERVKILTRADIEQDLPDKYKKNIRNRSKVVNKIPKEKPPIQLRILEAANTFETIKVKNSESTPRSQQKAVINEIKKLTDLRKNILKLKLDNELCG